MHKTSQPVITETRDRQSPADQGRRSSWGGAWGRGQLRRQSARQTCKAAPGAGPECRSAPARREVPKAREGTSPQDTGLVLTRSCDGVPTGQTKRQRDKPQPQAPPLKQDLRQTVYTDCGAGAHTLFGPCCLIQELKYSNRVFTQFVSFLFSHFSLQRARPMGSQVFDDVGPRDPLAPIHTLPPPAPSVRSHGDKHPHREPPLRSRPLSCPGRPQPCGS